MAASGSVVAGVKSNIMELELWLQGLYLQGDGHKPGLQ